MSSADHSYSDLIHTYLSGTATEAQIDRIETLMRTDPEFRVQFEAAEAKLKQEFDALEPVQPPAELLDETVQQIDRSAAPVTIRPQRQAQPGPWRTISFISSLAAAVAIGFHLFPATSSSVLSGQTKAVAFLEGDRANGTVIALYEDGDRLILARVSGVELGENQVQELWLVRQGAETPISLGLLPQGSDTGSFSMSIEHEVRPGQDTLAISIEPMGGSSQDGPSGPVVLAGMIEAI